jgi:hypothetical protein
MGHWTETRRGKGKNKSEAWSSVVADYTAEYGWSHSIRDVEKETLIDKVPPEHWVETEVRPGQWIYGRWEPRSVVMQMKPNPDAPQSEWLEVWEFEFDIHA